jgi:hypothetical protein
VVRLSISDAKLHCHHPVPSQGWSISFRDIFLIAEYTTNEGPKADDYFLVFVTREQGEFYYSSVTMYAAGVDESLTELESWLNCSFDLRLQSSATWNSRVLWPPEFAGSAYFCYEEVVPQGFWDRLRSRMKGNRIECRVADPIIEYLAAQIPPGANQEP